jgi:hypothetical protein
MYGIVCKMCTREEWDLDQSYGVVVNSCHMWPVHGHAYVVCVKFLQLDIN